MLLCLKSHQKKCNVVFICYLHPWISSRIVNMTHFNRFGLPGCRNINYANIFSRSLLTQYGLSALQNVAVNYQYRLNENSMEKLTIRYNGSDVILFQLLFNSLICSGWFQLQNMMLPTARCVRHMEISIVQYVLSALPKARGGRVWAPGLGSILGLSGPWFQ